MMQYSFRPDAPLTQRARSSIDQPWAVYSAIGDRPSLQLPNGARIALWICPSIVHYEFNPPRNPWLNAWARTEPPDVMGYGRQEYGSRVGFWRMLEVLDKFSTRCTAVANIGALSRYPEVTRAMLDRGWEIAGHGLLNTRFVYGMSAEEERGWYRDMKAIMRSLTGQELLGMGGAGPQEATEHTLELLAEEGFAYHTDWFCDDQPFPLRVKSGRLISMPYSVEVNDTLVFAAGGEAGQFAEIIKRQFDQLYSEGDRVMSIVLHPNLIGQPHRIGHLESALDYIFSFKDVWHTTGADIAKHYLAHVYDEAVRRMGTRW